GCAEQPAGGSPRRAVYRGKGQDDGGQSVGPGRAEANSERDARIQQEPRHVRLSPGLPARRGQYSAVGSLREFLPWSGKSLRNTTSACNRGIGRAAENSPAAIQSFSQQTSRGKV